MSSSKSSTSTKSLAKKLSSLTKTASALSSTAKTQGKDTSGIDSSIARSKAMVASAKSDNYSGKTSFKGSKEEKAFLASNIGTTSPVIPEKPVPTDTGAAYDAANASVIPEGYGFQQGTFVKDEKASDIMNATNEGNINLGNTAKQVLDYMNPEDNQMKNAYEETYGISEREAQRDLRRAERDKQRYTTELNAITTNRDASILALEDTGRGQTSGFIGGEQGRIQRQAAIAFANGISPLLGAKLSGSASPTEIVYKALDVFFSGTEPSDDELAKLGRMLYMVKKLGVNWNPADVPVVYQSKVFGAAR